MAQHLTIKLSSLTKSDFPMIPFFELKGIRLLRNKISQKITEKIAVARAIVL